MRRTKAYLREQRTSMIRILRISRDYWEKESARWHRMVDELNVIVAGHPGTRISVRHVLERFSKWAAEADANVKQDTRGLRKWRAKRV